MNAIQRVKPDQRRTLVVCPTYNEREMLPLFLEEFARTGFECLIVDDGSPDGTGELADAFAGSHPWCHVLHRPAKAGLGAAYRAGFEWALARGYHAIGQMDCDLSHPPQVLPEMAAALEQGAGLCLASRYVRGGGTAGWSLHRRLLSRAGCVGASAIMGLPCPDLSGGFKLWSADTLRAIDVGRPCPTATCSRSRQRFGRTVRASRSRRFRSCSESGWPAARKCPARSPWRA